MKTTNFEGKKCLKMYITYMFQYIFEIKIMQKTVFHVENKQAEVFSKVKVFAADFETGTLDGMIRKLDLDTTK